MNSDPIVEEIHRIRAELAARFNNDIGAIVEDARRRQAASGVPTITFRRETVPADTESAKDAKASETDVYRETQ